jgi:predicted nucleic acid-binding protein
VKPVLADTGFLVAIYDKHERYHSACVQAYESLDNPLVTCEPVIAEALHLLRFVPDASDGILASVAEGTLEIPFRLGESAASVQRIMKKYRHIPADFADACLIHMAEELDTGDILTLDSDFKHYRWRRNRAFHLLVSLD